MLYAPKTPSTEVEEEEDEVEEEEANGLLIHRKKPIMNIQITQSTLTTLKVRRGEVRDGPIIPIISATNTRSMATMNENEERIKKTRTVEETMSLRKKKAHYTSCSSPIKQLKNITSHIYGYWIMVAAIT